MLQIQDLTKKEWSNKENIKQDQENITIQVKLLGQKEHIIYYLQKYELIFIYKKFNTNIFKFITVFL